MGKWYSVPNYVRHKLEKKHYHYSDDPKTMEFYYPWVETIARSFPQASMAIGCLTINDLIQAGYIGLIEAWSKVDTDKSQAEIWSYLKVRIKGSIRREIDNHGTTIKVPRIELERHRKEMTKVDKYIVNIFPSFFDYMLKEVDDEIDSYASIKLEELIDEELERQTDNVDHRNILKCFYGVGTDKLSQKEIAEKFRKSPNNIGQIVNRLVKKMNNSEFEKNIENFYEN